MATGLPARVLLLLLLAPAASACRSPDSPEGPAPAAVLAEGNPLGTAVSPCGRYRLRLEHAEWREPPGERIRLSLQMGFRTGEPDAIPCGPARVTDLVPEDGAEFREGDLKGNASVHALYGLLLFHDLQVYHRSDHLRRLRVECRVLRVLSWRTFELDCPGPGGPGEGKEFLCPPYRVRVVGEGEGCSVAACGAEDLSAFPAAVRDLFWILGHGWVAEGAALRDAAGRELRCTDANGTGGCTAATYRRWVPGDPGEGSVRAIAYPVRGILRLPERYVVEVVPFEFTDLPLSRP